MKVWWTGAVLHYLVLAGLGTSLVWMVADRDLSSVFTVLGWGTAAFVNYNVRRVMRALDNNDIVLEV